jgi:ribosome-associated translation inhibitor RaiA
MPVSLHVSYRDVAQTPPLNELITHEAAKLERYFPRIISCRVLLDREASRTGAPYHARIVLSVPGREIVVNQAAGPGEVLDEVVRAAFKRAKRQLQDWARLKAS